MVDTMRMLRIVCVVVFALMMGYATRNLYTMSESGNLFKRYNNERKSSITLFAVSVIALASLGAFEVGRISTASASREYGARRYTDEQKPASESGNPSGIYSAP